MKYLWIVFFTSFLLIHDIQAGELKDFTSDGCSAFPNGTTNQNDLWLHCCYAHDLAYWRGGSYDARVIADRDLKSCVNEVGEHEIASLMLAGVRVGGSPYWPTSFRWAYGWPYLRGYKKLTEDELKEVEFKLKKIKLNK